MESCRQSCGEVFGANTRYRSRTDPAAAAEEGPTVNKLVIGKLSLRSALLQQYTESLSSPTHQDRVKTKELQSAQNLELECLAFRDTRAYACLALIADQILEQMAARPVSRWIHFQRASQYEGGQKRR